jgi:pilus assembly protein CpaB
MAGIAVKSGRRSGGNGRILLAAVAFGLLTAALVVAYLRNQERQQSGRNETSVAVVVAKREIPLGASITSGMIEVKLVTPESAVASAFSETGRVIGLRARYPISAGAQVVPGMVVQGGAADALSYVVPPGKRAISVGYSDVVGTGGHIRPGDFVDVLVLVEVWKLTGGVPPTSTDRPKGVYTVLQNIEVLAVSDNAQKVAASGPEAKTKDEIVKISADNKSVTLAVDPEQAQKLFLAEADGKIRLALRPFGEREEQSVAPFLEPIILPAARATATPPPR